MKKTEEIVKGVPVVLVTGASSGFGFLTCIQFAKAGYQVIAIIRDRKKRDKLIDAFCSLKLEHMIEIVELDLNNLERIEKTIGEIILAYSHIHVLVNSAGFMIKGIVEETRIDDWKQQFQTNFFGLVVLTKAVVKQMRKQRKGKVINLSSLFSRVSLPSYGPYIASKHALEGFSEALRLEMLPFDVYVSLIEPGAYKTEMWDTGIKQVGEREESSYLTVKQRMDLISKKMLKLSGNPNDVASLILKIANSPSPKLRYQPDFVSKCIWNLSNLVPSGIKEKIIIRLLS